MVGELAEGQGWRREERNALVQALSRAQHRVRNAKDARSWAKHLSSVDGDRGELVVLAELLQDFLEMRMAVLLPGADAVEPRIKFTS